MNVSTFLLLVLLPECEIIQREGVKRDKNLLLIFLELKVGQRLIRSMKIQFFSLLHIFYVICKNIQKDEWQKVFRIFQFVSSFLVGISYFHIFTIKINLFLSGMVSI